MFTTYEMYRDEYLVGRKAVISAADFLFYERKASQVIKEYTFDNINPDKPIPEPVKMCCCELAEMIFIAEQEQSTVGNIKSETVGKQSVTYTSGEELNRIRKDKERSVIRSWLANTGLLYRGMDIC